MSIYRTNNPLEFGELDGIIIDETAPVAGVIGVGTGIAILVGQFQRGPATLERMSGINEFNQVYGKSTFDGNKQLKNKKFSILKIIRAIADDAVKGTLSVNNDTVPSIKFDAKYFGVYGNKLKITIEAGTISGNKYTFTDTNTDAVLPIEVYDNIAIADVVAATFAASKLIDVTVLSVLTEPEATVITPLAAGSEGAIADDDYETAIAQASSERAGNVLFLDSYNATRNTYLKTHAAETTDKIVICAGSEAETPTEALAAAALLRDTAGRVIYAFNWMRTLISGVNEFTSPASWLASIISQTPPQIDPAAAANNEFLYGVTAIKNQLTRDVYKQFMAGGICSFEDDADIGFKIKSGVVTQILNSSKLTILRRRMADYLTNSIGKFLKNFQNGVNSKVQRTASKGSILDFVGTQETAGILPKDSEVQGGLAKLVDIDTNNSDDSLADGYYYIIYKQRIFSSMRFIVLQAEIGESVVVTEGE